ncbi:MAG: hypothetical protein ACP5HU_06115 [Phycisphaerae bacterium]
MIVVHVTHEAVEKIGGIGAVIGGLTTADAYKEKASRTILLGPLLQTDRPVNRRLGVGGQVIYSSMDSITPPEWRRKFNPIESTYDVGIIYGRRQVDCNWSDETEEVEVLLVDVFHANRDRLNLFKAELYKKFAVPSDRFEDTWEFEQYVRLAEPGFEALKALDANNGTEQMLLLAHEYMGMPTALKAVLDGSPNTRTVFYAHEVASVRPIVERHPGHDTMFYNVLRHCSADGKSLEQLFPSVLENYKHPLVKAGRYCDHVFAVGDYIEQELRFLDPHYRRIDIDLVYNGIPDIVLPIEEKQASRDLMARYAENLFGWRPSWTFTHVARPVLSKGLWRDLGVLDRLEAKLAGRGETAVYFMLGTLAGQRRGKDIRHMERMYGWPVNHEHGYPDLCGGEESLGDMVEAFNRGHEHVKAVFVNQWDWNREVCGTRMPEEMDFGDLRRGSDVEFGLSVYEPFGIAQLEPLCFGALCAVSNVCGCTGFARRAGQGESIDDNVIEGNFLEVSPSLDLAALLKLTIQQRNRVEQAEYERLAGLIFERLPRDESTLKRRVENGYKLSQRMSWQKVVEEYFLPSLDRVAAQTD